MSLKRIVFGLGSNLGDKDSYLNRAVEALENNLSLVNTRRSKIFKNPALLLPDSPAEWNQEYFNIAFSADIDLQKFTPDRILEIIGTIEKDLGRQKRARWAPREIDVDILLIEDFVIKSERLTVPHYDLLNRDFFLKTIEEIEPDWELV